MSRWHGPADRDEQTDPGDDAPAADDAAEPTLRDEVIRVLLAAGFRVLRAWPLDRGAFDGEVMVGEPYDAEGWELVAVSWHGGAGGSKGAQARFRAPREVAMSDLAAAGLVASDGGGLRVEVGWSGTPCGWVARMHAARRAVAA